MIGSVMRQAAAGLSSMRNYLRGQEKKQYGLVWPI